MAAGRVPFRIRVGVTGHRELGDEAAIVAALSTCFAQVGSWFPATDATPVVFALVSSLAEGADRLSVTTGLAHFGQAETELEVVLPFAEAEYEQDFGSNASIDEFRALLKRATRRAEVPALASRDAAYERAGQYVVDRSDLVVAVWDGEPARGRGGTAEIVDYARRQKKPIVVIAEDASIWPSTDTAGFPRGLRGQRQAWRRIDEYNRLSFGSARLSRQLRAEEDRFAESVAGSPIHWRCRLASEWALPHLVRADYLALKYQRGYNWLGATLFGASALAVTAVAAQQVFTPGEPLWGIVEVALMVLLLMGFMLGRRAGLHDRWIAYRSLAEAFRVAPFIALTDPPDRAGDSTVSEHAAELWFQRAFSEAWQRRPSLIAVPDDDAVELARILSEGWVAGQISYHRDAMCRFRRGHRRLTTSVFALFGITLLVGVSHVSGLVHDEPWAKILSFAAIALPGFGAALTGIRDQRQYRLHDERSKRTADRLVRMGRSLATETSLSAIQRMSLEVQALIAEENLDWSSVVEFQDVEIVL